MSRLRYVPSRLQAQQGNRVVASIQGRYHLRIRTPYIWRPVTMSIQNITATEVSATARPKDILLNYMKLLKIINNVYDI